MVEARFDFTATLLPNGKVLVTGGDRGYDAVPRALASAELYDPATGTWMATGSMTTGRYRHTATLLRNGKVLVAGGNLGGSSELWTRCCLASAELYDPATGTWTGTGSLIAARVDHSATLLLDGTVLVAGGDSYPGTGLEEVSAELYNPATGTWTATGNMIQFGHDHSATLLSDGKVFVLGGGTTPQWYDPSTRSWALADCMIGQPLEGEPFPTCRAGPSVTATVLQDGEMLVAGASPASVLYDPSNGSWKGTGSMIPLRFDFTSTLLPDGKVLAVGGSRGVFPNLALTSTDLYDPSTGIWTGAASMVEGRERHIAILLLDGTVLVVGGSAGEQLVDAETGQYVAPNLASAERYGPGNGS